MYRSFEPELSTVEHIIFDPQAKRGDLFVKYTFSRRYFNYAGVPASYALGIVQAMSAHRMLAEIKTCFSSSFTDPGDLPASIPFGRSVVLDTSSFMAAFNTQAAGFGRYA